MLPNYLKVLASQALLAILIPLALVSGFQINEPSRQTYNGPRTVISPNEPIFYVDTVYPSSRVLSCQTAGDKPELFNSVRWSGPNRMDNWDELRKRHKVTEEVPNSNVWDLEFKNPTNDDAGVYYCLGTYQSSDQLNTSIVVKVVTPIKLENCPERQFIVKGSTNNKITCRITADEPRVTIFKDGSTIDKYANRYKWDNEDGLVINGVVEESDAGRYVIKVKAISTGERREQFIDVQVHSKPEILPVNITDGETEIHAVEGDPAKLECKVSGNPQPLVYWRDPKLRNLTSVGGYFVNPEQGTLLINKANKVDDEGVFECFATNTVGTTSLRVSMAVDTKPQIVSFENKTVDDGSEVTFECRASGEPRPVFSVRKQGSNAYRIGDGVTRDMITQSEGGGANIYVYRAKVIASKFLFGVHYCNATNRASTAERIGQLYVNYKPDLSQTPLEQYYKLGKKLAVTCHIKAYPLPKVSWLIDNIPIINAEYNVKTSPDGQTHIVTMMPPAQAQSAFSRFICRAENIMGQEEVGILLRFTTPPGVVTVALVDRTPTTAKLTFSVLNEGGDRIKQFKYRLEGRSLDINNPIFDYRVDRLNDTLIDATPSQSTVYIIRNLLPYYAYRMAVRAVNDVGEGDESQISFETLKPTRPEPPLIIKPAAYPQLTSGIPSEYQNGYHLKWSPPDSDNGDVISRYIIRFNKIDSNSLDVLTDSGQERVIEQMNERPMHARIGPLEANQRYKIQIQARNRYGDSDPAIIKIYTTSDRPIMPEFDALTLAWLIEPTTSTLVILLLSAIVLLVVIDLIFCFCFQIGLTHIFRNCCFKAKTNSVISDKTYP